MINWIIFLQRHYRFCYYFNYFGRIITYFSFNCNIFYWFCLIFSAYFFNLLFLNRSINSYCYLVILNSFSFFDCFILKCWDRRLIIGNNNFLFHLIFGYLWYIFFQKFSIIYFINFFRSIFDCFNFLRLFGLIYFSRFRFIFK